MKLIISLTRRQAQAVLVAQLSRGHGVQRSADLIEAEKRIKAAIASALNPPGCVKLTRGVTLTCDQDREA